MSFPCSTINFITYTMHMNNKQNKKINKFIKAAAHKRKRARGQTDLCFSSVRFNGLR